MVFQQQMLLLFAFGAPVAGVVVVGWAERRATLHDTAAIASQEGK